MKQSWSERHGWRGWRDVPIVLAMLLALGGWCLLMFLIVRSYSDGVWYRAVS